MFKKDEPEKTALYWQTKSSYGCKVARVTPDVAELLNELLSRTARVEHEKLDVPATGADGVQLKALSQSIGVPGVWYSKTCSVSISTVLWALMQHLGIEAVVDESKPCHPVVIRKKGEAPPPC